MDKNFANILSREEVFLILKRDLECDDFEIKGYEVKPFSENLSGFLGIHYRLKAEIAFENGRTITKEYFAKKIPEDVPSHNWYAKTTGVYFKETEFYETVVRDVQMNLEHERNLTKWCPKLLYSRKERELLVMEDLGLQGYYMYPERTDMEMDFIKCTLKALAVMHSGPMVMAQMLSENKARHLPKGWSHGQATGLPSIYPQIAFECEAVADSNHPGNKCYEAGFRAEVAVIDHLPGYTEEQRAKIKAKLPDTLRQIFEFVAPSKKYRNTWLHGDLWANNVMFRNGSDGKVKDALIIDFQIARIAPPALEVVMFIHLVQSKEFRDKYLSELLNFYYEAFALEVQAAGYNVDAVLPRSEFDESCAYYYEFALLTQCMFYQMTLPPSEVIGKFLSSPELFDLNMLQDRSEMVVQAYTTDDLCRSKVTEVLNELIAFKKMDQ